MEPSLEVTVNEEDYNDGNATEVGSVMNVMGFGDLHLFLRDVTGRIRLNVIRNVRYCPTAPVFEI